jgi:hypothetical protein
VSTESPFRRDEPVSGSRIWIWLTGWSAALWFSFITIRSFILNLAGRSPVGMLVMLALEGLFLWVVFRAARDSSRCKSERNFEIMARALRAQNRFWIMIVFACALILLGLLVLMGHLGETINSFEHALQGQIAEEVEHGPVPSL